MHALGALQRAGKGESPQRLPCLLVTLCLGAPRYRSQVLGEGRPLCPEMPFPVLRGDKKGEGEEKEREREVCLLVGEVVVRGRWGGAGKGEA